MTCADEPCFCEFVSSVDETLREMFGHTLSTTGCPDSGAWSLRLGIHPDPSNGPCHRCRPADMKTRVLALHGFQILPGTICDRRGPPKQLPGHASSWKTRDVLLDSPGNRPVALDTKLLALSTGRVACDVHMVPDCTIVVQG